MEKIQNLTQLCITFRLLIETKTRQKAKLIKPIEIEDASLEIQALKLELAGLEDELCNHIKVPSYVSAPAKTDD